MFAAIFEWLLDNGATPYILVNASSPQVEVPRAHVKDQQIVLNIDPAAVQNWHQDKEAISFSARFSGKAENIYVPMTCLMAIYAQENGLGMAFPPQEESALEDELLAEESLVEDFLADDLSESSSVQAVALESDDSPEVDSQRPAVAKLAVKAVSELGAVDGVAKSSKKSSTDKKKSTKKKSHLKIIK